MLKNQTIDNVKTQWETFKKLTAKLDNDNINKLIEELGERIILCPYNQRDSEPCSHPGGLIRFSLELASAMRNLSKSFNMSIETSSIIKVSLFHAIGKIGDLNNEMYIVQDSDWHREKLGQIYKINELIDKMSTTHRSLFLLQNYGVFLTREEWVAIQTSSGSHFEENRFYIGHEPSLAILLQTAKRMIEHNI